MKHFLLAAAAVVTVGVSATFRPTPVRAQAPRGPIRSNSLPPEIVRQFSGSLGTAAVHPLAPRGPKIYECVVGDFGFWDWLEDGNITFLDPFVATGIVRLNGVQVGLWRLSGQGVADNGAISGVMQLDTDTGSFSIDFGFANSSGVRSRTPCRPIIGGTGKFANQKGNAGISATQVGFNVQLGVK